jgi:DNA polymerase-3 subunit epsilon
MGWFFFGGLFLAVLIVVFFAVLGGDDDEPKKVRYPGAEFDWSKLIQDKNWVVLDTETTGLGRKAEVIEIAILSSDGTVLLNERVKPIGPISREATEVHGISKRMLKDAPSWGDIFPEVQKALSGKLIVIYNASFDITVMQQTMKLHRSPSLDLSVVCAMLGFAQAYKQPSPKYPGEYRWIALGRACEREQIPLENAHSAKGDAEATRQIALRLAEGIWSGYRKRSKKPKTNSV